MVINTPKKWAVKVRLSKLLKKPGEAASMRARPF